MKKENFDMFYTQRSREKNEDVNFNRKYSVA